MDGGRIGSAIVCTIFTSCVYRADVVNIRYEVPFFCFHAQIYIKLGAELCVLILVGNISLATLVELSESNVVSALRLANIFEVILSSLSFCICCGWCQTILFGHMNIVGTSRDYRGIGIDVNTRPFAVLWPEEY